MTVDVAKLLRVFLDDVARPRYGYELMQLTGFASGKLYPILARLHWAGWLTRELEDVDPVAVGRPARRLYRLSGAAVPAARQALAELTEQLRPGPALPGRLHPEGGTS